MGVLFSDYQLNALVMFFLDMHSHGYDLGLFVLWSEMDTLFIQRKWTGRLPLV